MKKKEHRQKLPTDKEIIFSEYCNPAISLQAKMQTTVESSSKTALHLNVNFTPTFFRVDIWNCSSTIFYACTSKNNSNMCLFDGYLLMSYQRNMMFKFRHFRQFKGCLYHIWVSLCRAGKWPFNVISFLKVEPPCDQTWWGSPVFFNCQLLIICFRCQKHFGWTCGTILKYQNFDHFYPLSAVFGIFWGRITAFL